MRKLIEFTISTALVTAYILVGMVATSILSLAFMAMIMAGGQYVVPWMVHLFR